MPDMEKVIKGLETCSDVFYGCKGACSSCDYSQMEKCFGELVYDAITLLKEQEAKAIEYHDNPFTGLPVAHCPNCKRYARQFHSSVEEETHYCPWCGQAVKWE